MKRILLSVAVIIGVASALAGGTGAFFSDSESSTGNTFAAGAIDLLVDNESYYNGAVSTSTSWIAQDLTEGLLFLNFTDLKPDDEGEDTISLHVNDNDAWLCMDMTLTSNDDASSTEPELELDVPEDINDTWDGELAQHVEMLWWADDGDNVFEQGEAVLSGPATIADMFGGGNATGSISFDLADSETNVWGDDGPVPGAETRYIGKGWCFGTLTPNALPNPEVDRDPLVETGFDCDGTQLDNLTQTDALTLDIAFRAIQARSNEAFVCDEGSRTATLTVIKQIINDNGGNETVPDFQLFAVGGAVLPMTSGVPTEVLEGNYVITESGVSGYQATFSGDCDPAGNVTLAPGDNKTCTITNNDIAPNITLLKQVINDNGGTAVPIQFTLRIDGTVVPQNTSIAVTANSPHTITEDPRAGYSFSGISGHAKCPAALGGTATLDEGEAITCTITNDDN